MSKSSDMLNKTPRVQKNTEANEKQQLSDYSYIATYAYD